MGVKRNNWKMNYDIYWNSLLDICCELDKSALLSMRRVRIELINKNSHDNLQNEQNKRYLSLIWYACAKLFSNLAFCGVFYWQLVDKTLLVLFGQKFACVVMHNN